jgi:hypothetical protein
VLTRGTTQLSPSFKSELLSLFFNNPGIAVHTPEDFFSNFNPSGNEEQILSQLQAEIKSGDINTQAQHFPMILYLKALGIPVESLSGINELKKSQHTRYMKALSGNIPSVRTTHYPQSNLDYFNQLPQSFFLNVQAYTDELLTSPQKSTRKQASVVEAVESKEQEISLNRESAEALFKELQKYFDHDQLAELLMLDPLAIRKTDLSVEELENFASHILDALSWAYTTTGVHRANNEDIDQTNAPFTHEDVAVILSRILTARSKNTVEEWQKFTEKSLGPFKTRLQII